MKNRKQKAEDYQNKYGEIPIDINERLNYMYDKYGINEKKQNDIIQKRYQMLNVFQYADLNVLLLEEPEGTPRPRFRIINRKNFANAAFNSGQFVHVYSLNAKDDQVFMQRLLGEELLALNRLIYTPCIVEFNAYFKTPAAFNTTDTFLAEIGLIRPLVKPDWDNVGKKYSDMFNSNIWLDDSLVISGTVNKWYSILPRVEIKIRYLNMLQNKYQYNCINKKITEEAKYFGGEFL